MNVESKYGNETLKATISNGDHYSIKPTRECGIFKQLGLHENK